MAESLDDGSKKKRGRPRKDSAVETPRRHRVTITIPDDEIALFQEWADSEKLELATLCQQVCRKALDEAIANGAFSPRSAFGKVDLLGTIERYLEGAIDLWELEEMVKEARSPREGI
jgi:uncharacterized protein YqeY